MRAVHSAALLLALALAGCAGRAPRAPLPAVQQAPESHQRAREARLATATDWSLAGRVAVSNGRDGGSGRIDWRQLGPRYDVALSAPVTRQSWRIHGDGGHARLEGLAGGPVEGDDPAVLLREATGWEIPVAALASWARGLRADPAQFGPARLAFAADGRLASVEQAGWVVRYDGWQPGPGAELPRRLDASRGEARIRLLVDAWGAGPAP